MKKVVLMLIVFVSVFMLSSCNNNKTTIKNIDLVKITKDDEIDSTILIDKNSYDAYIVTNVDGVNEIEKIGVIRVMAIRINNLEVMYDVKCKEDVAEKILAIKDNQTVGVK